MNQDLAVDLRTGAQKVGLGLTKFREEADGSDGVDSSVRRLLLTTSPFLKVSPRDNEPLGIDAEPTYFSVRTI